MGKVGSSFGDYRDGYERNWASLKIRSERAKEVNKRAEQLLKGRDIYEQIESRTGVPWWFIGLCHYRESSFDFATYLGNGQPLGQRTTIVPKNRGPFTGPNAFVDGAIDALAIEHFVGASDWGIARTLYRLEGFNGYGYHGKGVNSPYLYGGSNLYGPPEARGGKYTRDHFFDPSVVDSQLGTAVILKALLGLDPGINLNGSGARDASLQPDEELAQDVLWVQRSLNQLGAIPQLVEDGKSGPKTRAAVSHFQQMNGLDDTGLADARTVAAIQQKLQPPTDMAADDVKAKLGSIEDLIRSLSINTESAQPTAGQRPTTELPELIDAVGQAIQRVQSTLPVPSAGTSSDDKLRKAIELVTTALVPTSDQTGSLGQVNGALGETIGNLLNGKKSAIGIIGAVLTQLLSQVPAGTGLGQVLGLLTPAAGLSPFAMPIFLGLTAWGVLGKLEKWAQGTAPSPSK